MASKPSTCCGKSAECVCAQQATCSCGKQPALHCNCEKASTENSVEGARCSCRARPSGQCNCARAATENLQPSGKTCDCGRRASANGGYNPSEHETDFTTKK
ncbi:hypothetical protein VTH06DRAFT_7190 [Thermothelomyces fergusii]